MRRALAFISRKSKVKETDEASLSTNDKAKNRAIKRQQLFDNATFMSNDYISNLFDMFRFMLFINKNLLQLITPAQVTSPTDSIKADIHELKTNINKMYDNNTAIIDIFTILKTNFNPSLIAFLNGFSRYSNDETKIFIYNLTKEKQINQIIPFFEFFIIIFFKMMGLKVMDMIYIDSEHVFFNYYMYYIYNKIPNLKQQSIARKFNNNYRLNMIKKHFFTSKLEKLDVLVVSHYDYNHNLSNYFQIYRAMFNMNSQPINIKTNNIDVDVTEIKFTNTNTNNFINRHFTLFACILRNYNIFELATDIKQESILGFIGADDEQYVMCCFNKTDFVRKFTWLDVDNKRFTDTELTISYKDNQYKFKFNTADKLLFYLNTTEEYYKGEKYKREEKLQICDSVDVIPQFGEISWFNSILMALLYSQDSRTFLLDKTKEKDWGKDDSLFMVLKNILNNSYSSYPSKRENLKKLFDKLKPEAILFKSLKYDEEAKKQYKLSKKTSDFSYFTSFIINFLKILKINFVDISYMRTDISILDYFKNTDKTRDYTKEDPTFTNHLFEQHLDDISLYLDSSRKPKIEETTIEIQSPDIDTIKQPKTRQIKAKQPEIKQNPDYLILFHYKLFSFTTTVPQNTAKFIPTSKYVSVADMEKILSHDEIIYFNGSEYKLDSCLLSNYNRSIGFHTIACITCNENKYIYNGFLNTTSSPCPLIPYNWNLKDKKPFSFDTTNRCRLNTESVNVGSELCFSFDNNNSDCILIYTKVVNPTVVYNTDSVETTSADKTSLSNLSAEIYDYLNKFTDEEIIDYLKTFKYFAKQEDTREQLLKKLKTEVKGLIFIIPKIRPLPPRTPNEKIQPLPRKSKSPVETIQSPSRTPQPLPRTLKQLRTSLSPDETIQPLPRTPQPPIEALSRKQRFLLPLGSKSREAQQAEEIQEISMTPRLTTHSGRGRTVRQVSVTR